MFRKGRNLVLRIKKALGQAPCSQSTMAFKETALFFPKKKKWPFLTILNLGSHCEGLAPNLRAEKNYESGDYARMRSAVAAC